MSKNIEIPLKAVSGNLAFSKDKVFAFYRLKTIDISFFSDEAKIGAIRKMSNVSELLLGDSTEPLEVFITSVELPINIEAWEEQVNHVYNEMGGESRNYDAFLRIHRRFLENNDFMRKVPYMGVCLGRRGALNLSDVNVLEAGFKSAFESIRDWADYVLSDVDDVAEAEEQRFKRLEERVSRIIRESDFLSGEKASAEEILLLVKKAFYPAMRVPGLDVDRRSRYGRGDIAIETIGRIDKRTNYLKFTQSYDGQEYQGCKAVMTFNRFDENLYYPGGGADSFLNNPGGSIGSSVPFTVFAHLRIIPTRKMIKEVQRRKADQKDELKNMSKGLKEEDVVVGSIGGEDFTKSLEDSNELLAIMANDKTPWIEGSYHIVVEARDEKELRDYCSSLKQDYSERGVGLIWTSYNQLELFINSLPGSSRVVKPFRQTTGLDLISMSGFNFSSDIGDPVLSGESII